MSIDVTAEVEVRRDREAVAAYMTDPATQVERLEPGRLVDMRAVEGPFPMRITYAFEDRDGATLVRNRVRGGGPRLVAPLVRRNIRRDLERLRDRLEVAEDVQAH